MIEGNDGYTVKEILTRVEEKVDGILQDHETRLRTLEEVKNRWMGAIGAVLGAAGLAANFFH